MKQWSSGQWQNWWRVRRSSVIAHRLSTITGADQIVVVKDGSIEAQGRHEDLLRHCPLYADLWQAHMGVKEGEKRYDRDIQRYLAVCR